MRRLTGSVLALPDANRAADITARDINSEESTKELLKVKVAKMLAAHVLAWTLE
jgi:hypothetical protein